MGHKLKLKYICKLLTEINGFDSSFHKPGEYFDKNFRINWADIPYSHFCEYPGPTT